MSSCARAWLALPSVALLMAGCASNVVILSTATRTGVEINATEAAQQGAHVGIERFEGVIMPIVATNKTGETIYLAEAYPIYSRYYFHSGGLLAKLAGKDDRGLILKQSFATGTAAKDAKVRTKVDDEYKRLKAHLPEPEALDGGTALSNLIEMIASEDPTFTSRVIEEVQKALNPQPPVTNLNQAQTAVASAVLAGKKEAIDKILRELQLKP